ncbi:MAG: SDR family NAD(P)-dependent oxidoreductase [Spirochaetales bacterium]|uniref:SDR family NAD(P)-dependent oxidoreductase n=1 Tax=Candidatus Thalassospirochaeta sargassi TaxID=3119039 RepID=A0AAJ1ML81_9SPIO|nr:SDR family NAD(P)-dependent oxidoreductase [Spirochaetales bacterium]
MNYYNDKRIWITGASSGIGKALAEILVTQGARLVLTARRKNLLEEIRTAAPETAEVSILDADLADIDALPEVCRKAWDEYSGLDIIIMNAGVSQRSLFRDMDFETGRNLFDINFFTHTKIMHELLPRLEAQGHGRIAAVTSLSGHIPSPLRIYYSSAKHALHGFYETLAAETWTSGIRVSMIIPGFVRTNISYNAVDGEGRAFGKLDPLQKSGADPSSAAKKILNKLERGKREIYVGYTTNAAVARFLGRVAPGLLLRILRNMKEV